MITQKIMYSAKKQVVIGIINFLGKFCPESLEELLGCLDISETQKEIIRIKYIYRVKGWKNIQIALADKHINIEERTLYRYYNKVIDMLINL